MGASEKRSEVKIAVNKILNLFEYKSSIIKNEQKTNRRLPRERAQRGQWE